MICSEKLILTTKNPREQSSKIVSKKPVKDCYCQVEMNKMYLKSSRTQYKPALSHHRCRSHRQLNETDTKVALTSPVSSKTIKRVCKIDYMPTSQFLRNVQNKIFELQTKRQTDCLGICSPSSDYHKLINTRKHDIITDEKTILSNKCKHVSGRAKTSTSLKVSAKSTASDQSKINYDNISQMQSELMLPKVTSSKKQISESNKGSVSKAIIQKRPMKQLYKQNCHCCYRNELEKTTRIVEDKYRERHNSSEYCEENNKCWEHSDNSTVDDVDQEIENLGKFRKQNYFETHGSSQMLVSSKSSSLLQQYLPNKRSSELVHKVHRQNLMAMTPLCATKQKKRIHYFPRFGAQQEKDIYNKNYKWKQFQSCPLTGHAVDLGIVKARQPSNSLALKYQKRTS